MPGIARALAWKEWREQRPVVLAGLALTVSMPLFLAAGLLATQREVTMNNLADGMPILILGLVWPLFAAACGATTIANEIGDGTLGFLLSRPVSRARVWLVKVAVGCLALLAIMAGSLLVTGLLWLMADRVGIAGVMELVSVSTAMVVLAGLSAAAAIYPASVFFSSFIGRAMTAAAAGLTAGLCLLGGIIVVWSRLDLVPRLEPALLLGEVALVAALLLLASFHVFTRGEMLRGAGARRSVLTAVVMVAGGALLIGGPFTYSQIRLGPGSAVLGDAQVSPDGGAVVATASTPEGGSSQIWLVHTDGSGFERLTGRLAYSPVFSPDGALVAYLSSRGPLGLKSDRLSLRLVTVDGGADRVLAENLGDSGSSPLPRVYQTEMSFSPDGANVALILGTDLLFVPVSGGPPRVAHLAGTPLADGRLAGWRPDSSGIIIVSGQGRGGKGTTVAAVPTRAGTPRIVYESDEDDPFIQWGAAPAGGIDRLPLLVRPEDEGDILKRRLLLVDLDDGAVLTVSNDACFPDLAFDGRTLVYTEVFGNRETGRRRVLHRMDLATMQDDTIAAIDGALWRMILSPSSDRMAVQRLGMNPSTPSVAIFDRAGRETGVPPGWPIPFGWSGRNRIIVGHDDPGGEPRRLAVVEVDTGELREIYPGTGLIE